MNQSHEKKKQKASSADALDAMKAAPAYHKLLLEKEQVRVLDTNIASGDTVPLHTHCCPSVMYVLSFSEFVRYDEQGKVLLDSRELSKKPQPGEAMWSAPLPPHSLKNVGPSDLRMITVELKSKEQ